MEEYTPDILTLEDEAGQEHVFEVIDAIDHDGEHYLAVVPYVETEEEAEAALAPEAEAALLSVPAWPQPERNKVQASKREKSRLMGS